MKYTELIEDWDKSRKEWREYEFRCGNVAAKIYMTLKKSLDISDDKLFKLIDPEEQNEDKLKSSNYTPIGATKLIEKGWAKFGLYIILQIAENTWPKTAMRFTSFVKIDGESIRFKLTEDDDEEKLSINYDGEDESKIIKKFEIVMRNHVHDSFKHWHEAV